MGGQGLTLGGGNSIGCREKKKKNTWEIDEDDKLHYAGKKNLSSMKGWKETPTGRWAFFIETFAGGDIH